METTKYFIFDRRIIGAMDSAKRVVEALAAASALSEHPTVGVVLIAVRVLLSALVTASVAANPINVKATQNVDTSTVITPNPDAE